MAYCNACGSPLGDSVKFCSHCGKSPHSVSDKTGFGQPPRIASLRRTPIEKFFYLLKNLPKIFTWENIARGIWTYLKQRTIGTIFMLPVMFAASSLMHIYLMAVKYQGFNKLSYGADVLGPNNMANGIFKWSFIPFVTFYLIGIMRSFGISLLASQLRMVPAGAGMAVGEIRRHISERILQERALMTIGTACLLAQICQRFIGGSFNFLFAVIAILLSLGTIRSRSREELALPLYDQFWWISFCAGIGLLIAYLGYGYFGILILGMGLLLWWQHNQGQGPRGTSGAFQEWLIFIGLTIGWYLICQHLGWADDGGAAEFKSAHPNGTILDYLKTNEGQIVVKYGLSAGGIATGSAVGGECAGYICGTGVVSLSKEMIDDMNQMWKTSGATDGGSGDYGKTPPVFYYHGSGISSSGSTDTDDRDLNPAYPSSRGKNPDRKIPDNRNVPYNQSHFDQFNHLSQEITDPNIYARLKALIAQAGKTGSVDEAELAAIIAAQDQLGAIHDAKVRDDAQKWGADQFQKNVQKLKDEVENERLKKLQDEWDEKKKKILAAMRERQIELEKQTARGVTFNEIMENFSDNVSHDIATLPGYFKGAARDVVLGIGGFVVNGVKSAYRELTDPNNYVALADAALHTGKDLLTSPIQSTQKVAKFYGDAARTAGGIVKGIVTDPVGFAAGVLGVDNWKKVIDPNVPLGERITRALYGAVDMGLSVGTGVMKITEKITGKVLETGSAVIKAGKTADGLIGGIKAETRLEKAGAGALKAAHGADEIAEVEKLKGAAASGQKFPPPTHDQRIDAWNSANRVGKDKVNEFEKALQSGDPMRIKRVTLEVQADKRALFDINQRDRALKQNFKNQIESIYEKTDAGVRQEIASRYEVLGNKDVEIIKPTNPSNAVKVGADRDVTVRVRAKVGEIVPDPDNPGKFIKVQQGQRIMKDVPSKELQEIYDKHFYQTATGQKLGTSPADIGKARAFSEKMDQVATDHIHTEAYGLGPKDLNAALKDKAAAFSDPTQVGQAMAYKGQHPFVRADELRQAGDYAKAESEIGDGMRQVTKQFKNQAVGRLEALKQQGLPVKPPDAKLQHAIEIMQKVEKQGLAPAQVEKELLKIGYTPHQVASDVGQYVESLQKLKPKG